MALFVDFHTHILPAVDDGSCGTEESLQLLKEEGRQGVETVVLTPHFYPQQDRPERFLERRQQAKERLLKAMAEEENLPKLVMGAEVYYFSGMAQWQGLRDFAIEGTDCVLVELPKGRWDSRIYDQLNDIYLNQRLIPVIAHIDRYINILNGKKIITALQRSNAVIQANAEFFINSRTRPFALKLLADGDINILGSDCHNMKDRRPNLVKAEEIILSRLGKEATERINLTAKEILSDYIKA